MRSKVIPFDRCSINNADEVDDGLAAVHGVAQVAASKRLPGIEWTRSAWPDRADGW